MKHLTLIYGEDIPAMKQMSEKIRKDKTKSVGLRSALLFSEVEKCDDVIVIGDFPHIKKAYKGKDTVEEPEDEGEELPEVKPSKKAKK